MKRQINKNVEKGYLPLDQCILTTTEMLEVKDLSVKVEGKLTLGGFCACWEWKIYDPLDVASIFYNRLLL